MIVQSGCAQILMTEHGLQVTTTNDYTAWMWTLNLFFYSPLWSLTCHVQSVYRYLSVLAQAFTLHSLLAVYTIR